MAKAKKSVVSKEVVHKDNPEEKKSPIRSYSTELGKWTLNEKQRELLKMIDDNIITVVLGPAGTSKTWVECYHALKGVMKHEITKVIFTKPIEESGEKLGFLPGDIADKINPYFESFTTNLAKLLGGKKTLLTPLFEKSVFEYRPLAYMRGATFDDSLMILDEAQNTDLRQLMLFVTRMGNNSKMIISGDISQSDIHKDSMGLTFLANMIKNIPGVGIFEFTEDDIVRHPILIEITKRYELVKNEQSLPRNKR